MSPQLDNAFWNPRVNFKAYKFSIGIKYDRLLRALKQYPGNIDKRSEGWLVETPCFRVEEDECCCFVYTQFKRNANASRLENRDILTTDFTGCIFDLKNKLIFVSTTNKQKLGRSIEQMAFKPIEGMTQISSCNYSGDFLLWLVYNFKKNNGKLTEGISIEDLTAVSSGYDRSNMHNAINSNTDVTGFTETKVILGLRRTATAINLKVVSDGMVYVFDLFVDGRINTKQGASFENVQEKAYYAMDIHGIIQKSYAEYSKIATREKWELDREQYSQDLLKTAKDAISSLLPVTEESN